MTERSIARILPSPAQPLKAAYAIAAELDAPVKRWSAMFFEHTGRHYQRLADEDVVDLLYGATEAAVYEGKDDEGKPFRKAWNPNPKAVMAVLHAFKHRVTLRRSVLEPDRCTALGNGVLVVHPDRARELLPHSAERFNLNSVAYDYDPAARAPLWDKFLCEVLPNEDDRKTLQEYFGYCMEDRTDEQVMLSLSGKRRAGKGTVLRILTALVGEANRHAASLKSLSGEFGLEPVIGKTLVTFGDVRWNVDTAAEAVRLLLEISGEDSVPVNVKGKPIVTVRIGARIVFAGNHIPRVNDPSGAFSSRLICLSFDHSLEGREDRGLEGKLKAELAGILNWALDGADRLAEQGRFTVSPQSAGIKAAVLDSGRGQSEFIEDYLEESEGFSVTDAEVMKEYLLWAESKGRFRDGTTADTLRPMILEAFPGVKNDRDTRRSVRTDKGPRKARAYKNLRVVIAEEPQVDPGIPDFEAFDS